MASQEVKVEKVPWTLLIIVAVLSGFIGLLWTLFGGTSTSPYSEFGGFANYAIPITITPFLLMLIAWPLTRLNFFKGKINPRTLGYLYIATIFVSFASSHQYYMDFQTFVLSRITDTPESLKYVSSIMAPSPDVCAPILVGRGISIPWGVWLPSLIFWWFLYTMPILFLMSIDTLFRRQWIDVEQLPAPHTLIAHEAIMQTTGTSLSSKRSLSPFLIGFILGIAFSFPLMMIGTFPWFPDIYGWRDRTCCGGVWYIQGTDPLASIIGFGTLQKNPIMISISYLIPLKILFNGWFWYLVYIVLMQAAYVMGYYTNAPGEGGCGRAWCAPSGLNGPPYKFHAITLVGGLTGLTLGTLWLNRRYIVETLRAGFGGLSKDRVAEMESREPLSYRSIWLMIIATAFGIVVVFMSAGLSITAASVMLLTIFVFNVASIRMYGLAGINPLSWENGQAFFKMFMWPTAPDPITTDYVIAQPFARISMSCGTIHADAIGGGMASGLASYKMAQLMGISNKSAFKITLFSFAIMPIIAFPVYLWVGYTFGLDNIPYTKVYEFNFRNYALNAVVWNNVPTSEPSIVYVLFGIIATSLLSICNARFIWFPFEPIGFICGFSYVDVAFGMWFPFLMAWVLKTVTMRIGGSKSYEKYGVPIAVGFTLGCLAIMLLTGAIRIYKFFYPF